MLDVQLLRAALEKGWTHIFIVVKIVEVKVVSEMSAKLGPCLRPGEGDDDHRWIISVEDLPFVPIQWCLLVCEPKLVGSTSTLHSSSMRLTGLISSVFHVHQGQR